MFYKKEIFKDNIFFSLLSLSPKKIEKKETSSSKNFNFNEKKYRRDISSLYYWKNFHTCQKKCTTFSKSILKTDFWFLKPEPHMTNFAIFFPLHNFTHGHSNLFSNFFFILSWLIITNSPETDFPKKKLQQNICQPFFLSKNKNKNSTSLPKFFGYYYTLKTY